MILAKDLVLNVPYMTIHTSYRAFVRYVYKYENSVVIEAWFPRQKKWTKIEVPLTYQCRALTAEELEAYHKILVDQCGKRWNERTGRLSGLSITAAFNRYFLQYQDFPDHKERVLEVMKEDFPDSNVVASWRKARSDWERGLNPDAKQLKYKKRGRKQ